MVVLDLGGLVAHERASTVPYTTTPSEVLLYRRANLERICDDLLRFLRLPPPAFLDDTQAVHAMQVSTRAFNVGVAPGAPGSFYQDSVGRGHSGRLAVSYRGWKARHPAHTRSTRHHSSFSTPSTPFPEPTYFTYNITVGR